jgi:ribosomal protein L37E
MEIWVKAIDWPEYEVSSYGNVRRIVQTKTKTYTRQLTPSKTKNGYMMVALCRVSGKKYYTVHRLVYESFNGKQDGLDICHNDGSRTNNRLENLRSDTRAGNMSDIIKHGSHIRGERCGTNKYKEEKIFNFKSELKNGMNVRQASKKHGIPCPTGYGIAKNITWKWLVV